MAYHLISIGVSNYSNPVNNLGYPDDDAGEISAIIRNSLGSELTLDVLLRSSEATQIGIRNALSDKALKSAGSKDTLIIFYSGHGDVGKGADGTDEAYLAPFDAAGDIKISGISTTELKTTLDSYNHGKKIVLLDCCYSGGANTKSISKIKHKDLTKLKAFQNQTYAEGTFLFTACKEDETAIEVQDLKHGLFTYYLIDELTKARHDEEVSLSGIHTPVTKAVEVAAKTYNHTQTPTLQMNSKGSISLPKLTKPPALKPDIIKVPSIPNEATPQVAVTQIELSDKKTTELVNNTVSLVENAARSKLDQITFRSHIGKVMQSVKEAHSELPKQAITVDDLAGMIADLEAKAYQLFITSAIVAIAAGDVAQTQFAEEVADILHWKNGMAGLVAAIETSDVVFVMILYILFVCCIYTGDYSTISKLLNTSIADWHHRGKFIKVVQQYDVHYADALGGNAKTVLSHVMDYLKVQKWLIDLLGIDQEKLTGLILQANLCIVVAYYHAGGRIYPGFNDFNIEQLGRLAHRIGTDNATQEAIAPILGVPPDQVAKTFSETVDYLNQNSGMHWWTMLSPDAFSDKGTLETD